MTTKIEVSMTQVHAEASCLPLRATRTQINKEKTCMSMVEVNTTIKYASLLYQRRHEDSVPGSRSPERNFKFQKQKEEEEIYRDVDRGTCGTKWSPKADEVEGGVKVCEVLHHCITVFIITSQL